MQCANDLSLVQVQVRFDFETLPYVVNRGIEEVNPLSPKSDQHQISPCNINAL